MNVKTKLLSAFAAVMISTVALGSTVTPNAVALVAPVTAAQHA